MTQARRPRSPRGSGELLRGEIIEAARECLVRLGSADAVSIRAVAEHVGVTSPSIYRHFADKDALIDAVVADSFAALDDAMERAAAGHDDPSERLHYQGMAYVRFAVEHPEHYHLMTRSIRAVPSEADRVLAASAVEHLSATVVECMDAGIFAKGDPVPIVLELWAAAHGIASLLVAKPYLPWGDVEQAADRVLRNAAVGRAIVDLMGEDLQPGDFGGFLARLKKRRRA